jgi:uncharacterized protein (TIGR03067 family)
MRTHVLMTLAAGCLLVASGPALVAQDAKGAAQAMKQLEGTWEVVSITQDGKKVSPEGQPKTHYVVKGGKWQVRKGNQAAEEGTLKIDPSTTPHHIDVTPTTGEHKGQTMHGIYEVKGDTARDCFAMQAGKQRPKSFSADAGSGCRLTVYRRVQR